MYTPIAYLHFRREDVALIKARALSGLLLRLARAEFACASATKYTDLSIFYTESRVKIRSCEKLGSGGE